MQLAAHGSYTDLDYPINFRRTKSGLEVDFVLGRGEVAIEVKGGNRVDLRDLKGLRQFTTEYSPRLTIVVCNETTKRIHDKMIIFPWKEFLYDLWAGKIIK